MNKRNNEKGITLLILVITVIAILILSTTIIINTNSMVNTKNLTDLETDINTLRQKISDFYNEYGEIPASIEYTDVSHLSNAGVLNDKEKESSFYVIDLQAMRGISLNFGMDYEAVKDTNTEKANKYTDLYIINEVTHNIFYVEGVKTKENNEYITYYTDYLTAENLPTITSE